LADPLGGPHFPVVCNLTKKHPPMKVLEVLKKDSSRFVKTLDQNLAPFHWQDGITRLSTITL